MKTKRRIPIPKRVEHEVLFRNQNVCCVCQKSGVQIHHIDGNPSNNELSNLCVLCIEHHAVASSKSSMIKGLEPSLLRKYKREWEGFLARKRRASIRSHLQSRTNEDKARLRFEIKKIIYSLPERKTAKQINDAIDYVYHWCLIEADIKDVISSLAAMHWFLEPIQIQIVAQRLYEFFWHLIGPHEISMDRADERQLLSTIELLGDLGFHAAVFKYRLKIVKAITKTFGLHPVRLTPA